MFKPNKSGLFLATLISIIVINNIYNHRLAIASNASLDNRINSSSTISRELILTKKSGGRSGGGSFKSRPSRSKTSSPSRNSRPRKSTTPSRNYNRNSPSPTYRDRRNPSPTYNNYSRGRRGNSGIFGFVSLLLLLVFFGGFILIAWFVYKLVKSNSDPSSQEERKIVKERDNDRVTISVLQVALSSNADQIQQDLSSLSTNVDTDTPEGLSKLMRESALIILRNDDCWTHIRSSSESLNISQAESVFDRISITERSKFSNETLSNIDGQLTTREGRSSDSDGFPAYVVVTLICGTADDNPLFEKLYSEDSLREALLKISAVREDYLMKLELLWTPQITGQYLTDEELLMEYTDIMPLQ